MSVKERGLIAKLKARALKKNSPQATILNISGDHIPGKEYVIGAVCRRLLNGSSLGSILE